MLVVNTDAGKQKHILRIENYYYFTREIERRCRNLYASALYNYVSQARERIEQCTREFNEYLLRKEFSLLLDYWAGVEKLLADGLPPEEVQFQVRVTLCARQ
jgi:hypothetical protein